MCNFWSTRIWNTKPRILSILYKSNLRSSYYKCSLLSMLSVCMYVLETILNNIKFSNLFYHIDKNIRSRSVLTHSKNKKFNFSTSLKPRKTLNNKFPRMLHYLVSLIIKSTMSISRMCRYLRKFHVLQRRETISVCILLFPAFIKLLVAMLFT